MKTVQAVLVVDRQLSILSCCLRPDPGSGQVTTSTTGIAGCWHWHCLCYSDSALCPRTRFGIPNSLVLNWTSDMNVLTFITEEIYILLDNLKFCKLTIWGWDLGLRTTSALIWLSKTQTPLCYLNVHWSVTKTLVLAQCALWWHTTLL